MHGIATRTPSRMSWKAIRSTWISLINSWHSHGELIFPTMLHFFFEAVALYNAMLCCFFCLTPGIMQVLQSSTKCSFPWYKKALQPCKWINQENVGDYSRLPPFESYWPKTKIQRKTLGRPSYSEKRWGDPVATICQKKQKRGRKKVKEVHWRSKWCELALNRRGMCVWCRGPLRDPIKVCPYSKGTWSDNTKQISVSAPQGGPNRWPFMAP